MTATESVKHYIKAMRSEAEQRRTFAADALVESERTYFLQRAAFFDACADEAEPKKHIFRMQALLTDPDGTETRGQVFEGTYDEAFEQAHAEGAATGLPFTVLDLAQVDITQS